MGTRPESLVSLPEVREMVDTARSFIIGDESIIGLFAASAECHRWASWMGLHPEIISLAKRWRDMANAAWNEWGLAENPLSEDFVRDQLIKDLGDDPRQVP